MNTGIAYWASVLLLALGAALLSKNAIQYAGIFFIGLAFLIPFYVILHAIDNRPFRGYGTYWGKDE